MPYDHWKATDPADELLGREPHEPAVPGSRLLLQPLLPNPAAVAMGVLIRDLMRTGVPSRLVDPVPRDFEDYAEHLLEVADAVDRYVLLVGEHIAGAASTKLKLQLFAGQLRAALEGNATFEIARAAEVLLEEMGSR